MDRLLQIAGAVLFGITIGLNRPAWKPYAPILLALGISMSIIGSALEKQNRKGVYIGIGFLVVALMVTLLFGCSTYHLYSENWQAGIFSETV